MTADRHERHWAAWHAGLNTVSEVAMAASVGVFYSIMMMLLLSGPLLAYMAYRHPCVVLPSLTIYYFFRSAPRALRRSVVSLKRSRPADACF